MHKKHTALRTIGLILTVALAACSGSPEPAPADAPDTAPSASIPPLPEARIDMVKDTHHGVVVEDPYRWLEDWEDPEVQAWSEGQNAHARAALAALPDRPAVRARISEILKSEGAVTYYNLRLAGEKHLFAMKSAPDKQQDYLVIMGPDGDPASERPFLDPNELDEDHGVSIDWYQESHDGSMVAVSLSSGGSEMGDVHVYRVPSGEQIDVVIPRVNGGTAGGDLAWMADDSGFYYTRYPRPGERPDEDLLFYQQVYQHTLGTPGEDDAYVIGKDFPKIAATRLKVDPATGRLLVWSQYGDSNTFAMWLRQPDGAWRQFSEFGDGAIEAEFGPDDAIYVISREEAPRGKVLRLDAADPDLATAEVVVPESDGAVSNSFYSRHSPDFLVAGDRLYLVMQVGGPNELRVYTLDGERLDPPEQLPVSTVFGLTLAGGSDIYFGNESYVAMQKWFRFSAQDGSSKKLAISSESPVDYSDVDVTREFATSKDGTRVPVNILMPKGFERDGTAAILVTGYGAYGISNTPFLSMSRHILFEHGMVFAEANLRGGGEYGETWHRQGNLTNKQNVFDDFAAVIRHLVAEGYAAPDRVAIIGGSNGGLLMGATMVQNPDLAAAVVSHVGVYDMVRVELDPNGTFNIPEFGTVKDPDQFAALHAYSPYHNVEDGQAYPPILLPTGANDPRVNPAHSRKFTARLQGAQGEEGVVLLRTSSDTGHGGGTPLDEVIELLSDQYAFIFHYVGVDVEP
jgi:prolyl oligopeptidase